MQPEKDGFPDWLGRLSEAAGMPVRSLKDLKTALSLRLDFFHEAGCRISDHALDPVVFKEKSEEEIESFFEKVLNGFKISKDDKAAYDALLAYKTHLMVFLGRAYAKRGWVMQIHTGTIRSTNSRMLKLLGPDTGFDAIGDYTFAESLAGLLNKLDETDQLPKTILYCLNPRDNEVLGTIMGCFQGGGIPGKIQFGSGWWFNDQKTGMILQMTALANLGLLSRFVGMLTDSRSFLSYTRHEYFRRILCNLIGEWVENGEFPADMTVLGDIVKDICYYKAEQFFNL